MDFLKIGKIFAQDYYAVPDYQRDYEWTNAQNSTLIEDVLAIARDNGGSNHFFGAIVTIPYEDGTGINKSIDFNDYDIEVNNVKHVVDGQQRLTSFSILIRALVDMINEDEGASDGYKDIAKRQLENIILGDAYYDMTYPAPRLILNGNTGHCYNKEIIKASTEDYSKVYKGAKRILGAYKLFKDELLAAKNDFIEEGLAASPDIFYKKVVDAITNRVVFVEIECDASSDAFQVFDSLNGKGLDLTAADRIKNIFMSWSPKGKGANKWGALVSEIGDEYLANFFISLFFYYNEKRISKNRLPEEFKIRYKESAQGDYDYFFNDIKKDGALYGKIRSQKTQNEKINEIISDFQALKLDQVYVLLFAVAKHYGEEIINDSAYLDFAKTLQALIVRMQVCEKSTNKLDTLFGACISLMKSKSAAISVITSRLKDEIKNTVGDSVFMAAFERFTTNDNKVAEFYLRHIENQIRKEKGNRSKVDKGLTVEHIIPQTLDDLKDWYGDKTIPAELEEDFNDMIVESIGNKALLYGDDNSSASNNNYQLKLNVYNNGKNGQDNGTPIDTFELIKDVIEHNPDEFLDGDVYKRAARLASYAVKIWK